MNEKEKLEKLIRDIIDGVHKRTGRSRFLLAWDIMHVAQQVRKENE